MNEHTGGLPTTPIGDSGEVFRVNSRASLLGVLLILSAIAFVSQQPYLSLDFALDDIFLLFEVGQVEVGHAHPVTFLMQNYTGQIFPLFRVLFFTLWHFFGVDPLPWHIFFTSVHIASAFGLFLLTKKYFTSDIGAFAASALWAGASIGRWDNPLIWITAGMLSSSFVWLVYSMVCLSHIQDRRSTLWAFGMSICLSLAMLTWGVISGLAPVLLLQYFFLERNPDQPKRKLILWALGGLIPFAIVFSWQAFTGISVVLGMRSLETAVEIPSVGPFDFILRSIALLAVPLGTLTFWNTDQPGGEDIAAKLFLAALVLGTLAFAARRSRRLCFALLLSSASYVVMTNVVRTSYDWERVLSNGRYNYIPTLPWCAVLGAAIDAIVNTRSKTARNLAILVLLGCSPFWIMHQRKVAIAAAREFHEEYDSSQQDVVENKRLIRKLAEYAAQNDMHLRIPEIPIDVPPVVSVQFPLSSFIAVYFPQGLPQIEVTLAESLKPSDVERVIEALSRSNEPKAPRWAYAIKEAVRFHQRVSWLSQFASSKGISVLFPRNLRIVIQPVHFRVQQFVFEGFENPPTNITFLEMQELSPQDFAPILQALSESDHPHAEYWLPIVEQSAASVSNLSPH